MDHNPDHRGRGRPIKYPWRTMEIGDSFFTHRQSGSIHSDAHTVAPNRKFRTKNVMVNGIVGVRVWRIA